MSSFIVSQRCMNNIIRGLYWNTEFKESHIELYEEQNLTSEKAFEKLAKGLYELNQSATKQRYPQDKSDYTKILKFKWEENGNQVTNIQLLKSLHCLRYQCSEGNAPNTILYKWIEKVITQLSQHIIYELPEYQKAEWD